MKGNNKLILCEAAMVEILNQQFKYQIKESTVVGCKALSDGTFEVRLEEERKEG